MLRQLKNAHIFQRLQNKKVLAAAAEVAKQKQKSASDVELASAHVNWAIYSFHIGTILYVWTA